MGKFLKNTALFLSFSILGYIFLVIIWGLFSPIALQKNLNYKFSGGFLDKKLAEIPNYSNVDILFIGSSHAYRGFDNRIFENAGYKAFNLGSSSQTPIQAMYLLEKYIKKLNPKLVVFEVYPDVFELDGIESGLDIISNEKIDLKTIEMVFSLNHIKIYNTFIFSAFCQIIGIEINREKIEDTYIKGGYVERNLSMFQAEIELPKKAWNFTELQKESFEKVLELIKKQNANLLLVQAPVTKLAYESITNNEEIDNYFSQKANYVNFNINSRLEDHLHFYDEHHLNQYGVQLFNREFLNYLQTPQ
jgi:uncharacterized protein YacL (UPF0231 family)